LYSFRFSSSYIRDIPSPSHPSSLHLSDIFASSSTHIASFFFFILHQKAQKMEQNKGFTIGNWVSEGKRIGKGAFATVFLGHHKDNPSVPPPPFLSLSPCMPALAHVCIVSRCTRIAGTRGDQGRGRGAAHTFQPEAQAAAGLGDQHHEDSQPRSRRHPSRRHHGAALLPLERWRPSRKPRDLRAR
jgi:hypothetical protein